MKPKAKPRKPRDIDMQGSKALMIRDYNNHPIFFFRYWIGIKELKRWHRLIGDRISYLESKDAK